MFLCNLKKARRLSSDLILWIWLSIFLAPVITAQTFPRIQPASLTITTNSTTPSTNQSLIIRDNNGNPVYELSVVAISLNNRTTESINISLTTAGAHSPVAEEKYESNLLNPDYWGHGDISFRPEYLCAANRNHPLFGARRSYNLRQMRIVAIITGIELNREGIVKMQMTVTVRRGTSNRKRPKDIQWGNPKNCSDIGLVQKTKRTPFAPPPVHQG